MEIQFLNLVSKILISHNFTSEHKQGRNWVILRVGRRYIYYRKDEIIHGPSPSVKCVTPLFRDMSLAKV